MYNFLFVQISEAFQDAKSQFPKNLFANFCTSHQTSSIDSFETSALTELHSNGSGRPVHHECPKEFNDILRIACLIELEFSQEMLCRRGLSRDCLTSERHSGRRYLDGKYLP